MSTEIKFVTSEAHEKNAKGETCYQAQLRHNTILNEKETKQAFAAYSGKHLSDVTYYVDSLSEFIAQAAHSRHTSSSAIAYSPPAAPAVRNSSCTIFSPMLSA